VIGCTPFRRLCIGMEHPKGVTMSSYPPQQQPPSYGQQPQPPPYQPQSPYGQPPYGQSPYGQSPYAQPKTNGLAIAGFVCAFLFSLVGLILSIIALSQINKSNGMQKGKGLAIAGIIISAVSIAVAILAFAANNS
jgi:hypothetical protein